MCSEIIPLSNILPDREYIINHILTGGFDPNKLRGYGIFPGSSIKLVFRSPTKNPAAYEVMGAVLALRNEDSKNIYVHPAVIYQAGHNYLRS